MTLLAPLVITGATAAAGASQLKKHIPEWDSRGFYPLSKLWGKTTIIATTAALLFGILTFLQTQNTVTSLIIAITALFGTVVAFSDSMVRKVPAEISNYMNGIAAIIMLSLIFTPVKAEVNEALAASHFFPRVPTDSVINIILFGLLLGAVGFLGFVKVKSNSIAQICLSIFQIGVFLAVYAPTLWLAYSSNASPYLKESAAALLLPMTALGVVWFFSWAVHDKIGGADIQYMYFMSMTSVFVIGPGGVLWAVMIGMIVQLAVHLLANKVGMGELRSVRNGPIAQFFENRAARKENREPQKTKMRRAVAFLPSLVIVSFIFLVIALIQ